jgi:membrane protease YdiL (CAAX protease family)
MNWDTHENRPPVEDSAWERPAREGRRSGRTGRGSGRTGRRSGREGLPPNDWPVWTGFAALLGGLALAIVLAQFIDIPAAALGAKITSKHTPHGIELANTFVEELSFVAVCILLARLGGRRLRSWQLGLWPTPPGRAVRLVSATLVAFFVFNVSWAQALKTSAKEHVLEQLGVNEATVLLVLSALLTTVVAPVCEETLFRGYIFGAFSKWRGWLPGAVMTGALFGAVHAGSAPGVDLVPLGVLGLLLCALYRATESLYPCIAAHCINNSLAFGLTENWGWQIPVLVAASLGTVALVWALLRAVGVISGVSTESAAPAGF